MPAFDITNHPLLTKSAAKLEVDALAEQTALAATLLLLPDDTSLYNATDLPKLKRALALQVNHLVARPETIDFISSETLGPLTTSYRTDPLIVDQRARVIVDEIAPPDRTGKYSIVTGLRGSQPEEGSILAHIFGMGHKDVVG